MTRDKLPPEDVEEWQSFSANIKPIKNRKLPISIKPSSLEGEGRVVGYYIQRTPPFYPLPQGEGKCLPTLSANQKSGVDKNSFNALRKGEMPVDARLDLHGKSFAQAFKLFHSFITKAATDGKRCLLVITGKGRPDAASTLKNALPDWINHAEIRPFILTYTPAAPKHGGSGAYTILLKRKRD